MGYILSFPHWFEIWLSWVGYHLSICVTAFILLPVFSLCCSPPLWVYDLKKNSLCYLWFWWSSGETKIVFYLICNLLGEFPLHFLYGYSLWIWMLLFCLPTTILNFLSLLIVFKIFLYFLCISLCQMHIIIMSIFCQYLCFISLDYCIG